MPQDLVYTRTKLSRKFTVDKIYNSIYKHVLNLKIMKRSLTKSKGIFYSMYYKKNYTKRLLRIITFLYRNNSVSIKLNDNTADCKNTILGVRRGCPLSSVILKTYMNETIIRRNRMNHTAAK
jgi:hypothetical protein